MVLENCHYPLDSRVRNEAETLAKAGFLVEVLAPRQPDRPDREVVGGVSVTRFPLLDGQGELLGTALEYLSAALVMGAVVLARLGRSRRGILHVHNPPDLFFPLLLLARLRGWSTVFDHHDDAAGMLRARLGRATPFESLLSWMRDRSARISDLTIVTNDTQRELVQRAARKVVVVRNAPPAWFGNHRPSPPTGRFRLVFLGEIGVQDRVEWTVEVLSALLARHDVDGELLVVGDGPQRGRVEERARRLGVSDRVNITGWVRYEDVPMLLASSHVGLDTAPLTEVNHGSTMVKILEYLATGLPVVASPLRETKAIGQGAVITVAEDRVGAFADAVVALLTDRRKWHLAAERSRKRGLGLRWEAQASKMLDAYSGLVAVAETDGSRRPPATRDPALSQCGNTVSVFSRGHRSG